MAPHLTAEEQGMAIAAAGKKLTTKQIFDLVKKMREENEVVMVDITNIRRFLRGAFERPQQ